MKTLLVAGSFIAALAVSPMTFAEHAPTSAEATSGSAIVTSGSAAVSGDNSSNSCTTTPADNSESLPVSGTATPSEK